jgi:transposase InsO family protein
MYRAIRECSTEKGYGTDEACDLLHASRSAYYKWASGKWSPRIMQNEMIAKEVEKIHMESPDKGYRRINDELRHDHHIHVNDKRILRICRAKDIKSTIKYRNMGCTRRAKNPQHTAENLLNRQFHADKPNEKWLTDVTEFKYRDGTRTQKLYLSAILDLYDRRIVAHVISERNDNPLVFKTFDKAVEANPDAHPLFHSDRGFQYTNRTFHHMLEKAGMTQSMSRVAHCIDNGPMEGFWGILKRERYYGRHFGSKKELVHMIEGYIRYYNTRRVQRRLGILTPIEKYELYFAA